jgi:hypothetical protein
MFGSVKIFKLARFLLLTLAIIAFLSQAVMAETDIYIEEGDDPVDTFSMPIYLYNDDPSFEFDAFSIKIKYDTIWETYCDTTILSFVEASPGSILTDTGWQEFDFQELSNGVVEISGSAGDGNTLSM